MKIKKGDNIIVITGKDKGKTGKVSKVFPKTNAVLVPGINIKKKHQKPRNQNQKGQIIDIPTPVDASNVKLETKVKKSK
ncbi:MAG: 50S ribosomal protein L24 [Candidatus Paceibacterota bacterium]